MGSIATDNQIFRRNGEVLPYSAIKELKSMTNAEIIVKGEVPLDLYAKILDRFNQSYCQEAGIIIFCENDTDIAASLKWVQDHGVEMTIACGRHSYYGASSTTGLVIDLRKMKKVTIDKEAMTVSAGGGCQAVDVETPLQDEGLYVVMGAANDTGIGGLTLGGGSGFLTGQYGLVCDNLVATKMVLADGRAVTASEKENADLFWGIRGGGSNFGVVTEFTYRVHKQQGDICYAELRYTPEKCRAILKLVEEMQKRVNENDGKLVVFMTFNNEDKLAAVHPLVLVFYDGSEAKTRELIAPLLEIRRFAEWIGTMPYAQSTVPGPTMFGPDTHRRYSTSNAQFVQSLDIDIITTLLGDFDEFLKKYGEAVCPSRIVIELRSYAKTASVPISAMAYASRRLATLVIMEVQYNTPTLDQASRTESKRMMGRVRDLVKKRGLNPEGGAFFNANISEGTEKVAEMFGENFARLRALKKKYDPNFVFNKWYPIPPAESIKHKDEGW